MHGTGVRRKDVTILRAYWLDVKGGRFVNWYARVAEGHMGYRYFGPGNDPAEAAELARTFYRPLGVELRQLTEIEGYGSDGSDPVEDLMVGLAAGTVPQGALGPLNMLAAGSRRSRK